MSHVIRKAKSLLIREEEAGTPYKSLPDKEKKIETPYKSKLMTCIEVLCTLVTKGPMRLTQLMDKLEMSESRLKQHLKLLWNRGLVEEEIFFGENETYYFVTERGLKVLKVISPLLKEAHRINVRNFEAISSVLSGADLALSLL